MSNLASLRVLPPFRIAASISASRCWWIARDMARRISPRSPNASSRSAGPPSERANRTARSKSTPSVPASASGSSVVGLTSDWSLPFAAIHAPPT